MAYSQKVKWSFKVLELENLARHMFAHIVLVTDYRLPTWLQKAKLGS